MSKRQIPNILSIIRLLLVPIFIIVFSSGDKETVTLFGLTLESKMLYCAIIYTVSSITDILDGYLARKYDWISDAGKILDPLADKAMQCAVLFCVAYKHRFFLWIAIVFLIKELTLLFGASLIFEKKNAVVVSSWYGKLATVIIYVIIMICMIFNPDSNTEIILGCITVGVMLFALIMYYIKIFRGQYGIKRISDTDREVKK